MPDWQLQIVHYLDDFIRVLPAGTDPLPAAQHYNDLCWLLGLTDNAKKSMEGTRVECLGIEIDTMLMTARLPASKIAKGLRLVVDALTAGRLT